MWLFSSGRGGLPVAVCAAAKTCRGTRPGGKFDTVQVRFRNDGGKRYLRTEAHVVHESAQLDTTKVTFNWTDANGPHTASRVVGKSESWKLPAGKNVQTRWVEFEAVPIK